MPEGQDWLQPREVAALLHVSPRTVTRWAKEGKLPCRRTLGGTVGPGHRRFLRVDIEELVADLTDERGEPT